MTRVVKAVALIAMFAMPALEPTIAAEAAQLERGRAAFTHRCGMCHREGGTGTNLMARRLGKDASVLEQRADLQPAYVRQVVRWGYLNMPRISRVELSDPELDAVIVYLTSARR